ncbi:hypothetical protein KEM48_008296 [Puccinia striiformis f. sp. tritici PST-130]|nr:hypothetical protein KEM48_008296 [Puccinia striiformis f. sp. tritici PST-130]
MNLTTTSTNSPNPLGPAALIPYPHRDELISSPPVRSSFRSLLQANRFSHWSTVAHLRPDNPSRWYITQESTLDPRFPSVVQLS